MAIQECHPRLHEEEEEEEEDQGLKADIRNDFHKMPRRVHFALFHFEHRDESVALEISSDDDDDIAGDGEEDKVAVVDLSMKNDHKVSELAPERRIDQ